MSHKQFLVGAGRTQATGTPAAPPTQCVRAGRCRQDIHQWTAERCRCWSFVIRSSSCAPSGASIQDLMQSRCPALQLLVTCSQAAAALSAEVWCSLADPDTFMGTGRQHLQASTNLLCQQHVIVEHLQQSAISETCELIGRKRVTTTPPTHTCSKLSMSDTCLRQCMYASSTCYCSRTELSMVIRRSLVIDFCTVYMHVRKFCARLERLAKILPPSATVLSQWLSRSDLFASCPAMHTQI